MSETSPNISIIVPVYNVEKYIIRCLDSIFCQQFSGTYEVIAVDDASTDSSLQILKRYQEQKPKLKIIEHGVNKKLSIARATGMKAATGDYVMHVDSDDWLLPNALANLYGMCLKSRADVVAFNHIREDDTGNKTYCGVIKEKIITSDKLLVQRHFYKSTWSKIVRRTLTTHMISGQVSVNNTEDLLYVSEILLRAETICLVPEYYYVYFVNTASLTSLVTAQDYLQQSTIILGQIQKIVAEYNVPPQMVANILNYFESWVYFEFAKIHFNRAEKISLDAEVVDRFFQCPLMSPSRRYRMQLSIKNKYISVLEIALRFGMIEALRIVFRKRNNSYSAE